MDYAQPDFLVSAEQLKEQLKVGNAKLRIYDCAVTLKRGLRGYETVSGREVWQRAAIPGSGFMDLIVDLSDTSSRLGFTLPGAEALQAGYNALGISDHSDVVLYSSGHVMWATRAWWMLHSSGHSQVSVLDGGLKAWQDAGGELRSGNCAYPPGDFAVNLDRSMWADQQQVLDAVVDGAVCTLNALPGAVHRGEGPSPYGRPGHIAGSINVEYDSLLRDGRFKSADEISQRMENGGVLDTPRTIAYCGGGISATIDAFALKLIGREDVRVYDGSLSEWVRDESLPMEVG